jgi:hypothetical protein
MAMSFWSSGPNTSIGAGVLGRLGSRPGHGRYLCPFHGYEFPFPDFHCISICGDFRRNLLKEVVVKYENGQAGRKIFKLPTVNKPTIRRIVLLYYAHGGNGQDRSAEPSPPTSINVQAEANTETAPAIAPTMTETSLQRPM